MNEIGCVAYGIGLGAIITLMVVWLPRIDDYSLGHDDGYTKGLEDGKLQKLVEFEDGTRQYCNPSNLGDIKYTIVEK